MGDHYAEAFSALPDRCFRFVHTGTGHAQHCPEPVVRAGGFIDAAGARWSVQACAAHAGELEEIPRRPGPRTAER